MKPWSRLVTAVLLVPLAASLSRGHEPPAARQFQIVMSMKQGDPLGSREEGTLKILGAPKLVTLENRPATFVSGGEVMIDGEFVPIGHLLHITAKRVEDGRLRLNLVLEHTEVLENRENAVRLQTNKARYLRTVKPGEVLKLRWGNSTGPQTWAELSVKEVTTH